MDSSSLLTTPNHGMQKDRESSRSSKRKRRRKDLIRALQPIIEAKLKRGTKDSIRVVLPRSLSDAYKGRTIRWTVRFEEECMMCYTNERVCVFCYGHGKDMCIGAGGEDMCNITKKECEHCKGTGVKMTYSTDCHLCHGKGKHAKKQKFEVFIEARCADKKAMGTLRICS